MKDYILQYPVEPQMSVAVCVTAKRVIPLGLKTPELNKDQAGRGGGTRNRKSAQPDVDSPNGEVVWGEECYV